MALAKTDFDGDAKADVVVVNFFDDSISVARGSGEATFEEPVHHTVGAMPLAVALADLDRDGREDVLVTVSSAGRLELLRNLGDGRLAAPIPAAGGVGAVAVDVGDIDRDGKPDAVTGDRTDQAVVVLRGNGDGTFAHATTLDLRSNARIGDVVLRDLDRDGSLDITVADRDNGVVSLFFARGGGLFESRQDLPVGGSPVSVFVADATGDGHFDLIVPDRAGDVVFVLEGDGARSFDLTRYPVGSVPVAATVYDLDADANPDVVVANSFSDSVSVLRALEGGTFGGGIDLAVGTTPVDVLVEDFNTDGRPDLLVANFDDDNCSMLLNGSAVSPVLGDLDGDGRRTDADRDQLIVEIFDGDGALTVAVAGGDRSSTSGADTNRNGRIEAADLTAISTLP